MRVKGQSWRCRRGKYELISNIKTYSFDFVISHQIHSVIFRIKAVPVTWTKTQIICPALLQATSSDSSQTKEFWSLSAETLRQHQTLWQISKISSESNLLLSLDNKTLQTGLSNKNIQTIITLTVFPVSSLKLHTGPWLARNKLSQLRWTQKKLPLKDKSENSKRHETEFIHIYSEKHKTSRESWQISASPLYSGNFIKHASTCGLQHPL